jgi:hypothetical protein
MFIFNIKPLDVGLLPPRNGSEPSYIIVCFVVRKTTSELEHAILTTIYLAGAKKHRHHQSHLYGLSNLEFFGSSEGPTFDLPSFSLSQ